MSRLPAPGSDDGVWGQVLNDFLAVEHNTDGTLKAAGSLASKADDSAVVHVSGDETIGGTKTFSTAPVVPSASFPQSAVANLTSTLSGKMTTPATPSSTALVQLGTDGTVSTTSKTQYWLEGGDWAASTFYQLNSIVRYTSNGYTRYYRCSTAHTSSSSLDFTKFVNVSMNETSLDQRYLNRAFAANTYYIAGQLVTNPDSGGNLVLYRAKTTFTSGSSFSSSDWDTLGGAASSANALVLPNVQTGTSYTLVLTDAGKAVELNNASSVTVTVPPSSSVAFVQGTVIEIFQRGAGQVTITPGAGVTFRTAASGVLRTQYSVATLRLSSTDEWVLAGDLV